jgi:hypothetical protein
LVKPLTWGGREPAPWSLRRIKMKVINSGSSEIKLASKGKFTALKANEVMEMDERTFIALKKIFPALEAQKEEVIVEAEAQPIETKKKGTKNGNRKKSK